MSIPNRASKITKAHKVLKKHYKPYVLADRPVLEHLLYACCLESAMHEAADEAFAPACWAALRRLGAVARPALS